MTEKVLASAEDSSWNATIAIPDALPNLLRRDPGKRTLWVECAKGHLNACVYPPADG